MTVSAVLAADAPRSSTASLHPGPFGVAAARVQARCTSADLARMPRAEECAAAATRKPTTLRILLRSINHDAKHALDVRPKVYLRPQPSNPQPAASSSTTKPPLGPTTRSYYSTPSDARRLVQMNAPSARLRA
ncbi:hypothetical protein PaG_00714 [Moesziomyces aphidis]|uniref:Uncharacterized protein n=1 Tax=Moesziomyces aphidis TaxID=84754 RepID=W3VVH6_MOEAP|nr:hypothetical protein PaG_00714 [Moesziomyces aphidis]